MTVTSASGVIPGRCWENRAEPRARAAIEGEDDRRSCQRSSRERSADDRCQLDLLALQQDGTADVSDSGSWGSPV